MAKWYENLYHVTAFQQAALLFEKKLLPHIKVVSKPPKVEALPPFRKIREGVDIEIVVGAEV